MAGSKTAKATQQAIEPKMHNGKDVKQVIGPSGLTIIIVPHALLEHFSQLRIA
jgi:hypothetical protein